MIDFPNNFATRIFPEMQRVALTRALAIWTMVVFFLIAVAAGACVWLVHETHLNPILIATNDSGAWSVIHENARVETYSANELMQQSVAVRAVRAWFNTSSDAAVNTENWADCNNITAVQNDVSATCNLCCLTSSDVFSSFTNGVMQDRAQRANGGETWLLSDSSISIARAGAYSDDGTMWRVSAILTSNRFNPKNIVVFVHTMRDAADAATRPQTLGYYVDKFYSYAVGDMK